MGMVILATLLSFVALCTGIFAVGSGSRWDYACKDILRGRKDAILYVWVTLSSMFSLVHTTACFQYLVTPVWGFDAHIQMWFALHAIVGVLLSTAHLYIHRVMLAGDAGKVYLWGNKS